MKNHFKKSLKYLILFITVMLSSCDKDQYEDSSQAETKYNFTVKEVSLSSLSNDDKLLKTVAQIKPKKQSVKGKIIYDPVNNFYFDDTSGKEIITPEGYKSYTFQIISDDDSSQVENVLFTQKENGEYDAYRVKYDFTDEELKTMTKEDIATQKASYTFITSSKPNFTSKTTVPCWSIEVWVEIPPHEGNLVGADVAGSYSGGWVSVAKVCSESNTEIETENNGDNTGWGTGTFSGNATPIQGSSIYTSPVVTPGSTFIKTIKPNILRSDFFQLSEKAHELTFNYLTLHNFDQISQSKVRGALLKLDVMVLSQLPYETHIAVFDNLVKNDFSIASISFANEMIKLVVADSVEVDTNAFHFIFKAQKGNTLLTELDSDFLLSVDQYMDADIADIYATDPDLIIYFGTHHVVKTFRLKALNPQWSFLKCYWEASKEVVHITLDVFGTVPVVGELADITNGVLYVIEGDGVNATLSMASAVPIAGWAAVSTKYAIKFRQASVIATKVKLVWKVTGDVITFGSRSQLRKVLGLVVGDLRQAHHIIPWNKQSKLAIQKASKSQHAFHMNEALNGIPLDNAIHSGSHPHYDNLIDEHLRNISPNATPDQAYEKVMEIITKVRTAIQNNPSVPLNQLNF